jgi:hypothetical protein
MDREPNGLPNVLVFGPFAKNQASWLANDSVPHCSSYTYTQDAARSRRAGQSESAWNQTARRDHANPPTGKEFIAMAAKEFGVVARWRI